MADNIDGNIKYYAISGVKQLATDNLDEASSVIGARVDYSNQDKIDELFGPTAVNFDNVIYDSISAGCTGYYLFLKKFPNVQNNDFVPSEDTLDDAWERNEGSDINELTACFEFLNNYNYSQTDTQNVYNRLKSKIENN